MRFRRMLMIPVLALVLAGASLPARADGPAAGTLEFSGVAHLNTFECTGGGCSGTFAGQTMNGAMSGLNAGVPWSVAVSGFSSFGATFSYADSCFGVGTATGSGTIIASAGNVTGTYGPVPGSPELPAPVTGISIAFAFDWERIGLTAVMPAVTISVTLTYVGPGPTYQTANVISNHSVQGLAAFVPLPPLPSVTDVCLGPAVVPLDAQVAGALVIH